MRNRRAFVFAACCAAIALSACTDAIGTTSANAAPRKKIPSRVSGDFIGSEGEEITVAGQTIGPDGQFYQLQSSNLEHQWVVYLPLSGATIAVYGYNFESSLLPDSDIPYNGGDISVGVSKNGETVGAGGLHANMDGGIGVYTLPSGGVLTLDAYPNAGCHFEGWALNRVFPYESTSTSYTYSGSGDAHFTGTFSCGR